MVSKNKVFEEARGLAGRAEKVKHYGRMEPLGKRLLVSRLRVFGEHRSKEKHPHAAASKRFPAIRG
jgi:hypothetical protein